jgi:hypothetical protein
MFTNKYKENSNFLEKSKTPESEKSMSNILQSIAYYEQEIPMEWLEADYFGYIYLTYDQKNQMSYVGKRQRRIEETNDYYGSGTIISKIQKKRGTSFLKKIILGICNTKEELEYCEAECKDFFNVLNPLYGYNILRKDTGGDTMSRNPRKKEIFEAIKETVSDPIWKTTVGKEATRKRLKTLKKHLNDGSVIIWNTDLTKETDERIAKSVKKQIEIRNDPEWIKEIGKPAVEKAKRTYRLRYELGKIKIWCENETKETHISLQSISDKKSNYWKNLSEDERKEVGKKISNKRNDPNWKETAGKEATRKQQETFEKNGTVKGENNPMYGTTFTWYTNGKENRRGILENIDFLISQGFYKGRSNKNPEEASKNIKEAQRKIAKRGAENCNSKKVINLDTEKIFGSIGEASIFYNIKRYHIDGCCKNRKETCSKGYHWAYYNE